MNLVGKNILVLLVLVVCQFSASRALDNGLARKPPMGWRARGRFSCETNCTTNPHDCINSQLFESMVDKLKAEGYENVGYKYVDIDDDCWSEMERNTKGKLMDNKKRFPTGIEKLADYIQGRNFKFGIYGNCGTKTCAGYPGQLKSDNNLEDNYFEMDALTYSQLKVDSLKFDGYNLDPQKKESICPKMASALNGTKRQVLLLCGWSSDLLSSNIKPNYDLAKESCNVWRYFDDVEDSWQSILSIVDFTSKYQRDILKYHGPGYWFDPGRLVIGNFALSLAQAKAQMALWSIWAAPLYMSNDLRTIDKKMADVLKNEELISVNQDPLGVFGLMTGTQDDGRIMVFVKPILPIRLGCPSFAIVYLNRNSLGNRKRVSFNIRNLLKNSPAGLALLRYTEIEKELGKNVDLRKCMEKIHLGMTKKFNNLVSRSDGDISLEETKFSFEVNDLLEKGKKLPPVYLNSTLDLVVEPSGVRAVKLVAIQG